MNWNVRLAAVLGMAALACGARAAEAEAVHTTVARLPIAVSAVAPVRMVETAPGRYFLDFGRDAYAALELTVPQPEPGRKIAVHLGEALSAPQTVHRTPGGSIRYLAAEVELKAGQKVYRVALTKKDARLMPPEVGAVMPFRYVELDNAPPGLAAANARQLAAHYPFDDAAASFECADPKLTAIWELCKHTMKATSFGGVFVDGDRERTPYEADAYINQLGWYGCTPDFTLPRYSHEYLIRKATWPTEWIMFSVLMAWEDCLYSVETSSLKEFYPELQAKTLAALERGDGLISTLAPPVPAEVGRAIHMGKIRDIVDWPAGERDGCELKPVNTVVNAFHARALDRMARIAAVLNKPEDAQRYRAAAAKTAAALNAKLVDPATGLYVDGEGSAHSSLHANMFPLAFGLVPPERVAKVTAFVRSRGMACSVYGAQFLMDALFDHGQAAHALALMTAPGDRSWTHMVEGVGTTIALEAWDNKYKPNQDWNHAWGAAPANLLPRKLMGIEPLEPGFAKLRIRPQPGALKWASIRVPTVRGPLSARFDNGAEFKLEVEIPPGASAVLGLPAGPGGLVLDGKPVRGTAGEGGVFAEPVGPGKHTLVRQPAAGGR